MTVLPGQRIEIPDSLEALPEAANVAEVAVPPTVGEQVEAPPGRKYPERIENPDTTEVDGQIALEKKAPSRVEIPNEQSDPLLAPAFRAERPGILNRLQSTLFGTDVENDPLETPRAFGSMGGAILGAEAGLKAGAALGRLVPPINPMINPVTGTLLFGTVGGLFGGAAGAYQGTSIPEDSNDFIIGVLDYFNIQHELEGDIGLSPAELQYRKENEALLDFATGGGLTVIKGGVRIGGRLATGLTKYTDRTASIAAKEFDIWLAPVMLGERKIARMFVNVMGRFPFISGSIVKTAEKAELQLVSSLESVGERVGVLSSQSDLGRLIYNDARTFLKQTNDYFAVRYKAVFKRAAEQGVEIEPTFLMDKAEEILRQITSKGVIPVEGATVDPVVLAQVRDFINKYITVMGAKIDPKTVAAMKLANPEDAAKGLIKDTVVQRQTLTSMDGFLAAADQTLASLEPGQKKYAMSLIKQLKGAATKDMLENAIGEGAEHITGSLRALDVEFSTVMSEVFETAAANNIKVVRQGGLGKATMQEATQVQVDMLAKTMIRMASPQSIKEVFKLVGPKTFKSIVATTIDDAVRHGELTNAQGVIEGFSSKKFGKILGLDRAGSLSKSRVESLTEMLKLAESPITVDHLQTLMQVAKAVESLPIPNVSTFLQRKAVLGGFSGLVKGILPGSGLMATSGATGAAFGGVVGALWGMTWFVGTGKLISRMIGDNRNAQMLVDVMDSEVAGVKKWKLASQLIRTSIASLPDSEYPEKIKKEMTAIADAGMKSYENLFEDAK